MRSRLLYREHGQVIRTRRSRGLADALFAVCCIAALLALLAWGHARDEEAAGRGLFEAGLIVGRADMQETVSEAYLQGRADAAVELGTGCQSPAEPPAKPMRLRQRGGVL